MTANGDTRAVLKDAAVAQATTKFYRNLFQHHHAVMLLIDPSTGAILHANDAAGIFYGYGRGALTGLKVTDLNTLPAAEVHAVMQSACSGENGPFIFQHRLADGRLRDVEVFSGPIAEGERTLLVSIVHDVTDRRRVETRLRENERRLSLAIGATADAIWEWNLATGETYYSPRWYEILGYADREIPMDFKGWKSLCHPEDFEATMALIQSRLSSSEDQTYAAEFRMRAKDGRWLWILGRGRVVERNAAGEPVLLSGTNTDITAQKQTEAALRLSEEKFRSAFAEARIGFALRNPDGFLVDANPAYCALTGYTLEELRTFHFDKLIHPDDLADNQDLVARMLAGEISSFVVENRYLRKNGAAVWVRKSVSMVRNDKGRPQWFNTLVEDITKRKQEEKARHLINEELTEYAYALTHNLKAPLRAVQNYTNFLFEDLADSLENEPRRYLEGIRSAVRQGHDQIEDLENLYRIKHHEVTIESFALQELFDEMQAIFEDRPDRVLAAARDCPELRGERFLLRQTLIELIRNGFKFNRSKVKKVTLGCRPVAPGKGVEICVRDNGIGIAPRYHEQIFRIFQRLHTESEYEGTGIGLAIVKRAVQKMGATLHLESDEGRGCLFSIRLPVAMVSGP